MTQVAVNVVPYSSLPSNLLRARAVRRLFDVRRARSPNLARESGRAAEPDGAATAFSFS